MITEHSHHLSKKRKAANGKGASSADSDSETFKSSILPNSPVPAEFGRLLEEMESILRMPVWVVIQNSCPRCGAGLDIGFQLYKAIQLSANTLPQGKPLAILLESPGGDAHFAYRIARLLQRRTENQLIAIVPQYAKSAATLIALGASHLIMGENAEIGPLDVQEEDLDKERSGSALDAVQSLEHLNSFGLKAYDQAMGLMVGRTGKRMDSLMPHALTYVANFLNPLLQKIDTVDFTHKSRELKVAEEYAVRLMLHAGYPQESASAIAKKLVVSYPTHGFVIDRDEAARPSSSRNGDSAHGLGLNVLDIGSKFKGLEKVMFELVPFLDGMDGPLTIIGRIERLKNEKATKSRFQDAKIGKNGNSRSR